MKGKRKVYKGKGEMPQAASEGTYFLHRPRPRSATKKMIEELASKKTIEPHDDAVEQLEEGGQ